MTPVMLPETNVRQPPELRCRRIESTWARSPIVDAMPVSANGTLTLSGQDEAQLRRYWDKLSADGTVGVPLEKAPWGDAFGMCTDRFGVAWMVNIAGAGS